MKFKKKKLLILSSLIIPIILSLLILKFWNYDERLLITAGPLVSILLYGVFSFTPFPTDTLSILNGAVFGPLVGILLSWMGNNLAAYIEYFLGRSISHISNFEEKKGKLPFGLGKFPVNSPIFLIFARFIPWFGSKMVCLSAGIYKISFWEFTWTTFIVNLWGAFTMALLGYSLVRFF